MRRFSTSKKMRHTAREMFDIVADVEAYPDFLPLCDNLTIKARERQDNHDVLIASMGVRYKSFTESFTSRVVLNREDLKIDVTYIDGPISHLVNRWAFTAMAAGGCELDFYLEYKFRNIAMQLLMGSVFDKVFSRMVESFQARADEIYGLKE